MPNPSKRAALLPDLTLPALRRTRGMPTLSQIAGCDAWLIMLPLNQNGSTRPALSARLPHVTDLRIALAREQPKAGQCCAFTLPNARQTLAVVGVLAHDAEPFAALQLAGAMAKLAGGRLAGRVAVLAEAPAAASTPLTEALLAAVLAQDFALPRFGNVPARRRLQRQRDRRDRRCHQAHRRPGRHRHPGRA